MGMRQKTARLPKIDGGGGRSNSREDLSGVGGQVKITNDAAEGRQGNLRQERESMSPFCNNNVVGGRLEGKTAFLICPGKQGTKDQNWRPNGSSQGENDGESPPADGQERGG